jgi:HJR/Mrr/RecB family endonuclease
MLAMVFLAVVALIWQWASEHPLMALFVIPSTVVALALIGRHERLKQQAILDARMKDEHVPSMSPIEFERFVARQLEKAGWKVVHCGRPGDQGCDVLAELRGFKAVVQCKLCRAGNGAVQEVVGARMFYGAQVMAVVALGFTEAARSLASSNGVHLLHYSELGRLERNARIP